MQYLFRFLLINLCLLALSAYAAGDDNTPVFHKGVNLSSWLANAPRQTLFDRDFIQIKQAGFDHVRLPFNPEYFGFKLSPGADAKGADAIDFLPLDRAIGLAVQNGLPVILDLHTGFDFLGRIEKYPETEQQFIDLWITIAKRYKSYPPSMLAFELLNEPQYYNAESRYAVLARRLVNTVRIYDKDHLIIVGAPRGSSIDGLLKLEPINDPHIAYDFHFYEPYIITHQGIKSGFENKMIRYFHNLPYPSDRVDHNAGFYTDHAPNPMQAQSELDEYVNAGWNADHIAQRLKRAKDWAQANHVQIICGEFGVLRPYSDPDSRYRWINDTRTALEADGIGWELWDYTDGFGIAELHGKTTTDADGAVHFVDATKGSRVIEPEAIKALGLK